MTKSAELVPGTKSAELVPGFRGLRMQQAPSYLLGVPQVHSRCRILPPTFGFQWEQRIAFAEVV